MRRRAATLLFAYLLLGIVSAGGPAYSQQQSARAIKVIVPYPPGGGADVLVHIGVDQVGSMGGPTMVVENHPGAGTLIGTMDAVRAAPDGNTLLLTNNALLLAPHLRKVDFDPFASLNSICQVGSTPIISIVNSASPYRSLDLIDAARVEPDALTFGAGIGALRTRLRDADHSAGFPHDAGAVYGYAPRGGGGVCWPHRYRLRRLSAGRRVVPVRQASCTRHEFAVTHRLATRRADGKRDRLQGFRSGALVRAVRPAGTPHDIETQIATWFSRAAQVPEVKSRLAAQIETAALCGAPSHRTFTGALTTTAKSFAMPKSRRNRRVSGIAGEVRE